MAAAAADAENWKTGIDMNKQDWALNVRKRCPDLNFPPEFLTTLEKIPTRMVWDLNTLHATPDGRSLQAWHDDPLESSYLVSDIERLVYSVFHDMMILTQLPPRLGHSLEDGGEDPIEGLVEEFKEMRRNLTDEQLMRLLYEYWRENCGSYVSWFMERVDLWKRLKGEIDELAEELTTLHAEQTADFVWSKENRQEDRESAQRDQERRRRFGNSQ